MRKSQIPRLEVCVDAHGSPTLLYSQLPWHFTSTQVLALVFGLDTRERVKHPGISHRGHGGHREGILRLCALRISV